ncbi:uncharacterized protein LOC124448235 [Xenia sp. Carnegie-2017]|uniref:uncharacterized protein LOC124448235 n=1 Tax=Xenia sp. Carnegie-2017 TaxID=2897299 RepID=UPI001F043CD0|nr:uncharacterized protein LOC124448235 [Xenia sp. Carnegie-2017]
MRNETGECSEHVLSCQKATGTTAHDLYTAITTILQLHGVSFEKLVAQTYDGASTISGCYNGLQAIKKEKIGNHIIFVHCYAHTLNLVLSDSTCVAIDVITLFDSLEKLHVLFNNSHKVHELFQLVQKNENLKIFSIKRLNTVRWNAREFCLNVFLLRFECIMRELQKVAEERSFTESQRATANGLQAAFQTKQFVATACLFQEIFGITGPLSRYLQSVNAEFGKAMDMVDSSISRIQIIRDKPEKIIEMSDSFALDVEWRSTRPLRRRPMDGEQARDDLADSPKAQWKRDTFYKVLDSIQSSMKNRFEKNRPLMKSFALFASNQFDELSSNYKTSHDLQSAVKAFCDVYKIDSQRCATELSSFAETFNKFHCSQFTTQSGIDHNEQNFESIDVGDGDDDDDENHSDTDISKHSNNASITEKAKTPSFLDAVKLLFSKVPFSRRIPNIMQSLFNCSGHTHQLSN